MEMKPHKWAKEIKAWADGAEIEWRFFAGDFEWTNWISTEKSPKEWNVKVKGEYKFDGDFSTFNDDRFELRIKPQQQQCSCCGQRLTDVPKKPQYLYAWSTEIGMAITSYKEDIPSQYKYIGKIKLEQDDA